MARSLLRRYGVLIFLLVINLPIWHVVGLLPPFGLALTALLFIALADGRAGLAALLRRITAWRVGIGWYAIAILLPFASVLLANLLHLLRGGKLYALNYAAFADPIPLLLYVVLSAGLAEETGWRGYALPRLQALVGPLPASVLLGLVWALWHATGMFFEVSDGVARAGFVLETIALAVVMTWMFNRTGGSVLLAILYHVLDDVALGPIVPQVSGAPVELGLIRALVMVVVAAALVVAVGPMLGLPHARAAAHDPIAAGR